jgi:hypothetical protein
VAFDVSAWNIEWANRLEYSSTAANDGAIDLTEYYTVDMMNFHYLINRLIGFGACYDANGFPKQGCSSFLIFQIYDQGTTPPAGCSQRIVVSKYNYVIAANAFRKYYSLENYIFSSPAILVLHFSESDNLENLGKIGGAGANKGLITILIYIH